MMILALVVAAVTLASIGLCQDEDPGWVSLFNGKDLSGWTKMNSGNFEVADGVIRYTGGGNGWLRSNQSFADFEVHYEWRYTDPEGNHDSGLFLRCGLAGNPWPDQGYQMNMGPKDNLGSVSGIKGTRNRPDLIHKPGEWNTYEVVVIGDKAIGIINDQKAWDAYDVGHPEGGYLGLQAEGPHWEARAIRVRRLK